MSKLFEYIRMKFRVAHIYTLNRDRYDILKECAYHEVGHIMSAYYVGWGVSLARVLVEGNDIYGKTTYDFYQDKLIVNLIGNRERAVTESQVEVAIKRFILVVGGPISESIFMGKNLEDLLYRDSPDRNLMNVILRYLKNSGVSQYTVDEALLKVKNFLSSENTIKASRKIALMIIASNNHQIDRENIQRIITSYSLPKYF